MGYWARVFRFYARSAEPERAKENSMTGTPEEATVETGDSQIPTPYGCMSIVALGLVTIAVVAVFSLEIGMEILK
jgi:hypothetical protein